MKALVHGVLLVERGWPGHFILADRCVWHRNTLLSIPGFMVVVSSVGNMRDSRDPRTVVPLGGMPGVAGHRPYWFETMAFVGVPRDGYVEGDVSRRVRLPRGVGRVFEQDDRAAERMHDAAVKSVLQRLIRIRARQDRLTAKRAGGDYAGRIIH